MVQPSSFEEEIKSYKNKQNACVKLIEIVSNLWFNDSIELVLFRNQLVDRRVSLILNLHKKTSHLSNPELHIEETLKIAQAIQQLEIAPSRIDIGTLALEVRDLQLHDEEILSFLDKKMKEANEQVPFQPRDIVLYGFGRIGRLLARELISKVGGGKQLRLRAIVTRDSIDAKTLEKRANLLRHDSIHGDFEANIEIDTTQGALIINGSTVHIISAKNPEEIDYTKYGIRDALVIDNTGAFRDDKELARHLQSKGAAQVLLTAPGKGVPNIVYGVNEHVINTKEASIFSAASCTTNAISPILAVIEEKIGITRGHIETIHSYTNDQNLVDNMHNKSRRGRAAALNMVITETGAGSAVAKVLPPLAGILTSNAIRVPVPNGSLAILSLELKSNTTTEAINGLLREAALHGKLVEQIAYSSNGELVSSDIIGTTAASVVDAPATIVSTDGSHAILYIWYDNEYGYTHQVMRLARHIAGVRRYTYY
ncbi:glyceraldehyde-3-phosphate dehydrogenase [Sphingobacterium psychroaquaticum]|uniref:Glyceraldehyde 3-phosphate dehydrogenase n=1 Tax=Sphingobacterium psychroaquaticum TaxID=561061 RepID=A0A1X7L247_9SPHI|nr:glyceraldehyde-3-phosphate dehydrogenase [Sphingobacterium psychroaquaticum]SMG47820.1 glyceraldehyde 3-phosphate dehydrogenase [Sphingobacterium psychroaquaticum]